MIGGAIPLSWAGAALTCRATGRTSPPPPGPVPCSACARHRFPACPTSPARPLPPTWIRPAARGS